MAQTIRVQVTEDDLSNGDYKAVEAALARAVGGPCRAEIDACDVDLVFSETPGVRLTWNFRTPDVVSRRLYHEDADAGRPYSFDVPLPPRLAAFLAAGEDDRG